LLFRSLIRPLTFRQEVSISRQQLAPFMIILTNSSFCVLNFLLPAGKQSFAEDDGTVQKIEGACLNNEFLLGNIEHH